MEHVLAVGLAAGQGVRLRPLTLKAEGYIRSKASVCFLGERIVNWMLHTIRRHGMQELLFITRGKENRGQVKSHVGYGDRWGMRIRYSPTEVDGEDTGSAGALLENLPMCAPHVSELFVFPTDSMFECNLPGMLDFHRRSGAAVTIASVAFPPEVIAGQYGMILSDAHGRVSGFREKPSITEIQALMKSYPVDHGRPLPMLTNAGCYFMDPQVLSTLENDPAIRHRPERLFDIGANLLPWLVKHGYPVYQYTIDRMGDLGNIPSYLQTMCEVLNGQFPSLTPLLSADPKLPAGVVIDLTSWEMVDGVSGLSLREKVASGQVSLHPPLRIGKYVRIEPGVSLSTCNIDDECLIQHGATIVHSSIGESSIIGPKSHLQHVVTGTMVKVNSNPEHPVLLSGNTAIGDAVVIQPGVTIASRTCVYPQVTIPSGVRVMTPTEITAASVHSLDRTPSSTQANVAIPASLSSPIVLRMPREVVASVPQTRTFHVFIDKII